VTKSTIAMPALLQNTTTFAAGLGAGSSKREPATALMHFLASPGTQALLKANGFDPDPR
jgi:ABC-type molybdate transport system substrate-binding protein